MSFDHNGILMISQHWFRLWLGVVRQQAITRTNADPDLCCDMASLSHNESQIWTRTNSNNFSQQRTVVFWFRLATILSLLEAPYLMEAPLKGSANYHKVPKLAQTEVLQLVAWRQALLIETLQNPYHASQPGPPRQPKQPCLLMVTWTGVAESRLNMHVAITQFKRPHDVQTGMKYKCPR